MEKIAEIGRTNHGLMVDDGVLTFDDAIFEHTNAIFGHKDTITEHNETKSISVLCNRNVGSRDLIVGPSIDLQSNYDAKR